MCIYEIVQRKTPKFYKKGKNNSSNVQSYELHLVEYHPSSNTVFEKMFKRESLHC